MKGVPGVMTFPSKEVKGGMMIAFLAWASISLLIWKQNKQRCCAQHYLKLFSGGCVTLFAAIVLWVCKSILMTFQEHVDDVRYTYSAADAVDRSCKNEAKFSRMSSHSLEVRIPLSQSPSGISLCVHS